MDPRLKKAIENGKKAVEVLTLNKESLRKKKEKEDLDAENLLKAEELKKAKKWIEESFEDEVKKAILENKTYVEVPSRYFGEAVASEVEGMFYHCEVHEVRDIDMGHYNDYTYFVSWDKNWIKKMKDDAQLRAYRNY